MNADAAEKKQSELDKVAQILGINIFEKSRKLSSESKESSENARIQEKTSDLVKEPKTNSDRFKEKSPKPMESSSQPLQGTSIYDYYDTGNHWCKDCNTTCGTMFDFFTHMHNKKHRQTLDPYNRPWAAKTQNETKQEVTKRIDKIPVPAKGSEFLIPVTGYYCQLCSEFFGDQISAEQHVKSHLHNEKYKKHVDENPLYEERRNLDHQAGLSVIQETERRLRRKLCEKQKEENDEKTTKTAKKEETKNIKELGDGNNECEISKRKEIPNGEKCGIKLKLKKDDKEVEKEERKEESEKESKLTTFGKFSWRKSDRDEKNQGKDIAVSKEESSEEGKDKENKSQSGKQNSKPIAIKLSGKTVIPHTSPWTPVVSSSSQTKIRPNLPIPVMVLRKTAVTTVSKPAPLNTFLSIKSSGTTAKPLPVVKEGNPDIVLPPDIISKAFGGEVVVLKGSQEDIKQEAEECEHESETKAVEHANVTKAQEHAEVVAKAQVKARELAAMVKEQDVSHMTKANEQSLERPYRRPPLLPLPPGPPLSLSVPQPPPIVFAPPPPLPPKQLVILADDMAPGVSEDDKNILEVPMCPRPLPPPAVFGEHVKKLKKNNSSLAAGNAKDLYDIFYNSSGRNPAESKLMNSAILEKEKLNLTEKEKNTSLQVNSKPSCNPFSEEFLCNVYTSSASNPETEEVKDEKTMTIDEITEIKTSVEGDLEKVSFSDTQSTLSEADDLARTTSYPFHNEEEVGIPVPSEFNKKSSKPEKSELAVSPLLLDGFNEPSVSLETTEHEISDDRSDTQLSEISNNLPETVSDSVQNDSYSKELSIDLKLDTKECNSGKSPQPSKGQYSDSELNKVELDTFLTKNEQEDLNGSQLKDGEDFNVINILESEEITNENFVNVTTRSTTEEKHEQANPFPLSCETKELQMEKTEVLDSISSTNEIKPSYVEFMFIEHDTQKSSASDLELSGTEERRTIETESANFSTLQTEMGQESLDILPTEISIGHLGEVTLSFTDLNTEVLNTSTADNFDLNNTYPELSFEQSTTFSLDLENEGVSPKSDETKAMDSPRLKPNLELQTIDFTLGNIIVEHEVVDILPTEILNEDNVDSPKLEMVAPICLESSKMSELDTDQPVIESEIINFVAFTSDDQEEKFCSVVSDAIIPHVVSSASKDDIAEVSMPLVQLQDMSSVSMPQPPYSSKGDTPDQLLWSSGGENIQNQTLTCMESILPKLKESGEVGGSGDSEMYRLKNQMQTSIDKLTKTEEEKNDDKFEVKNKLASEVTDKSAEHLSWTSSH
uniref:C2H2-type domain-containing protein n=2 Tax=Micrurus lemniscatus lemniscatus TaxID=129467 RepID=A0A2D4I2X5_MICLE